MADGTVGGAPNVVFLHQSFAQLWIVLWLIGTKIPTMIDNSYKHLNRADNLRSLRRVAAWPRSAVVP